MPVGRFRVTVALVHFDCTGVSLTFERTQFITQVCSEKIITVVRAARMVFSIIVNQFLKIGLDEKMEALFFESR